MRPEPSNRERKKENAVSITTGFIINMGIASVVISVLVFNLSGPTGQILDLTERSHIEVVGKSVVSDLEEADRLARKGINGTVTIDQPESGTQYTVEIEKEGGGYDVRVSSGSLTTRHRYTGDSKIDGAPVDFSSGTEVRVEMEPNEPLEVTG